MCQLNRAPKGLPDKPESDDDVCKLSGLFVDKIL
jgi:hypothetical protein